jgi:hypothetical protein
MSAVNHPKHYNELGAKCSKCEHPIECIDVVERMEFNIGNAVKYLWRVGKKSDSPFEDLEKAIWYIRRELGRRIAGTSSAHPTVPDGAYASQNASVRVFGAWRGREHDVPICRGDTAAVIGKNILAAMESWTS